MNKQLLGAAAISIISISGTALAKESGSISGGHERGAVGHTSSHSQGAITSPPGSKHESRRPSIRTGTVVKQGDPHMSSKARREAKRAEK